MQKPIPKQTLQRLPLYLDYLNSLGPQFPPTVTATSIAKRFDRKHAQVRMDLSLVNATEQPKIGYPTERLIENIKAALGHGSANRETANNKTCSNEQTGDSKTSSNQQTGDSKTSSNQQTGDSKTSSDQQTGDGKTSSNQQTGDREASINTDTGTNSGNKADPAAQQAQPIFTAAEVSASDAKTRNKGGNLVDITVFVGSSCHIKGSRQVVEQLEQLIQQRGLENVVELRGAFCMGNCTSGVSAMVDGKLFSLTPHTTVSFFETEVVRRIATLGTKGDQPT